MNTQPLWTFGEAPANSKKNSKEDGNNKSKEKEDKYSAADNLMAMWARQNKKLK